MEKEERLQRGDWAPNFATLDLTGQMTELGLLADYGVWIAFYRYASCPMCNQHFDDVASQQRKLADNNVVFIAIFESEIRYFPKHLTNKSLPFVKMIPDPTKALYEMYKVERSWAKLFKPQAAMARIQAGLKGYKEETIDGPLDRVPAHFLILPGGSIHQAKYGKHAADHVKWRELDDFFAAVRGTRSQVIRARNAEYEAPPILTTPMSRSQSAPPPPPGGGASAEADAALAAIEAELAAQGQIGEAVESYDRGEPSQPIRVTTQPVITMTEVSSSKITDEFTLPPETEDDKTIVLETTRKRSNE